MVMKHVMVNLDPQMHQLASYKLEKCGSSVSEYVRLCLERLVMEGIDLPNPAQIAADKVTDSIIKDLKSQQKVITTTEILTAEQEEKARIRLEKIETAARTILLRYPNFERCLPVNDVYGDFSQVLDELMGEIATTAGYQPTLLEVTKVWREVTA